MSNWYERRLTLFDVESSGTDPHRDRIITAAIIHAGGGRDTKTVEWLVNPGITIPQAAIDVHGITNEQAADGDAPWTATAQIAAELIQSGNPVVGHNITYDLTMLWAELTRHGHTDLAHPIRALHPVIDTLVIGKHLDPYRPKNPNGKRPDEACGSHRLIDTCRVWGITLSEQDAHGATADALAAGRLAWRMASDPLRFASFYRANQQFTDIGGMPLVSLHQWQKEEKRRQAESFAAYLVKQGKPDDVSREWPVQPPPPGWDPDQLPTETTKKDAAA